MTSATDRLSVLLPSAPAPSRRAFLSGAVDLGYADLADWTGRTRGLFARFGVGRGDRVAVASVDVAAVSALYLACLAHGAVCVMIDPGVSASEALVLMSHARPALIFADGALLDRAEALSRADGPPVVAIAAPAPARTAFGLLIRKKPAAPAGSYPAILDGAPRFDGPSDVGDSDPGLILFTSGTTSRPKGVVLPRGALAAQMEVMLRRFSLDADSRIVNHLPLHHTDGLNQGPLLAAVAGAELIRPEPVTLQTLGAMLDLVYQRCATHLVTVPTVLAMMERLSSDYDDSFRHMEFRFIESTAAPLDSSLWERSERRFGVSIVNCYGLTETVCEALYCGPDDESRRIGTVGKPDGFEVRLVDETGVDVADGGIGELLLRGSGLMSGYFENSEATAEALRDGWLFTGDLASRDDAGFVRIVGRRKNVIIRASVNIYPDDLNRAALGCQGVTAAATVGVADDVLGERVVLFVTEDGSLGAETRDRVFVHLRQVLSEEKIPNEVRRLDSLPYGPSGKVELAKLRGILDAAERDESGVPLADAVVDEAAAAFGRPPDALSRASTDGTTDGWDSLTFLEFIMRLERRFDFRMTPREVMLIDSLGDAIAVVEARRGPDAEAAR